MPRLKGFTLAELLIVLAIFSLITVLATPSFSQAIKANQARSFANTLYHQLLFARTTAITMNTVVTICASDDQVNCSSTQDWSDKKLIIFTDHNLDRSIDEKDELLQVMPAPDNGQLLWKASLGRTYQQWQASGMTSHNGSFYYCPEDKNLQNARIIIINRGGRPYFGQDHNNDGIQENSQKKNISC